MKKKVLYFVAIFVGLYFCSSIVYLCESKEKTVTSADGNNAINEKKYESYREACRDGDFDAAHKLLDRMKENAKDWEDENKVQEAEDYIFNNEVNALVSQNSEEANTRIIYLLNEIPIEGIKLSIGTNASSSGSLYGKSCNRYNIKLNQILELAISTGNQDIAQKILPLYKEDEIIRDWDVVAYTYETKNAAQKKYDDAVKTGAFK